MSHLNAGCSRPSARSATSRQAANPLLLVITASVEPAGKRRRLDHCRRWFASSRRPWPKRGPAPPTGPVISRPSGIAADGLPAGLAASPILFGLAMIILDVRRLANTIALAVSKAVAEIPGIILLVWVKGGEAGEANP